MIRTLYSLIGELINSLGDIDRVFHKNYNNFRPKANIKKIAQERQWYILEPYQTQFRILLKDNVIKDDYSYMSTTTLY